MKRTIFLLAALSLMLVAPTGCIFSPDDSDNGGGGGGAVELPFPGDRDQLMENFQTIYEKMEFADYEKMLHEDYITILQQSTTDQYEDVGSELDLAAELRIHTRMFSGQPVTDPAGALVPGIADIEFQVFEQQGGWTTSSLTDRIPNAEKALFDVIFLFNRGELYSTLKVQGQIEFYVTSRDSLHAGATRQYYQMLGQRDLTLDN